MLPIALAKAMVQQRCTTSHAPVRYFQPVWGAKWPSIGFAVDNREAWPLSYSLGLVGGAGGSLSRLGHFGRSQAEGPAGCRESVPAAAVARAAPPAPAVALAQCGSTVLDLRQSMVRWRNSLLIVKPETVLRWHRRDWRAYWSWRSNRQHRRIGRRPIPQNLQTLIRQMAVSGDAISDRGVDGPAGGRMLRLGSMATTISDSRSRQPVWRDVRTPPAASWH